MNAIEVMESISTDIEKRWIEYLAELRDAPRDYEEGTFRTSQLGHPCDRYLLFASRLGNHPNRNLLGAFSIGYLYENAILEEISDMDLKFDVTGEKDGIAGSIEIESDESGVAIGVDLKTTSLKSPPTTLAELVALGGYMKGYVTQAQCYCHLFDLSGVVILFVSKTTGAMTPCFILRNDDDIKAILKRVKRLQKMDFDKEVSTSMEHLPYSECVQCHFLGLCAEDKKEPLVITIDDLNKDEITLTEKILELVRADADYKQTKTRLKETLTRFGTEVRIVTDSGSVSLSKKGRMEVKSDKRPSL